MHKQIMQSGLALAMLVGPFSLFYLPGKSGAASAPDLISAAQLDVQKSPDVLSLPSSLNGNVDCIQDGPYDCIIDTSYGKFSSSGYVKRHKTSGYYQLISHVDNRPRSIAIPNSTTVINYTTEPPYGFYLYFTKNFASSVTITTVLGTNIQQYQISRPYDGKLVDKANRRLAADYTSMSFSANGRWLVVSMPNVAMLRVNLDTFEVVSFATGFNYTIGLDPAIKTAITNDGRYAVVASKTFGRFEIYDLSTCAAVPDTINGPVACQSKNLQSLMQQKVPGYIAVGQARFVNNATLRLYASYSSGAGNKIAPFTVNPSGTGAYQHDYLALGDSYISGEGAYSYLQGTDTADNLCHVSILSYPYLLARDLDYNSFHSVACSGAKMDDLMNLSDDYSGQTINKIARRSRDVNNIRTNFLPGYIDQLDFVTTYQPQVITLSIGGNDVGFSNILASCVSPLNLATCYSTYEDRLELVRQINAQFLNLAVTYQTLKNISPPDTRIYVIGYPQIVKPGGTCGLNVQLNADEVIFAYQFTAYLNTIIQQAAAKAGVFYVDTKDAFTGHRLCEAPPGEFAVNGLTKGSNFPSLFGGFIRGPFANESYHPTPLGNILLRDAILGATAGLGSAQSSPSLIAAPPAEDGQDILNAARSGRAVNVASFNNNLSGDVLPRGSTSDVFISGLENSLKPLASYRAELRPGPVLLGNATADSAGDLLLQTTVPTSISTGFYVLHVYGANVANEPIDIYKTVYVADGGEDYNGNGIPNDSDPCVFVDASGQDYDQDTVDDACDGIIGEAPSPPPPAVNTSDSSSSLAQTLQPSAGLPVANQDPVILASSIQTGQSQTPNTELRASAPLANPVNNSATTPEGLPASGGQDFFVSYYAQPAAPAIIASDAATKKPKVLAAQTSVTAKQRDDLSKIIVASVGSLFVVSSSLILARKIKL